MQQNMQLYMYLPVHIHIIHLHRHIRIHMRIHIIHRYSMSTPTRIIRHVASVQCLLTKGWSYLAMTVHRIIQAKLVFLVIEPLETYLPLA